MAQYHYTYFIIGLFYFHVLTDVINLIVLGSQDSTKGAGGEVGLLITLFFMERVLTILYRLGKQCMGRDKPGDKQDMFEMCFELVLTFFFGDFFIAGCKMVQWEKEYEQWQTNLRSLAHANNGKVPRNQSKQFKSEKQLPPISPYQLMILRSYGFSMIAMFINMHAMFTGVGTNFAVLLNVLVQMVFMTCGILAVYHMYEQDPIPFKERMFMFGIIFSEMMAKLFLWGYFAQLSYSRGIYILVILELFGGFILEISYQCLDEENQEEQTKTKRGMLGQMFGPCSNIEYCMKNGLFPLLVGLQLAFYGRYEDIMIKEIDEEPKQMKKGNVPIALRAFESTILVICAIVQLGQGEARQQLGFFIFGLLAYLISTGVSIFFGFKKYSKKTPYERSFRPPPLEFEEQGIAHIQKGIKDKASQALGFFGFGKKKKEDAYKEQNPQDPQQQQQAPFSPQQQVGSQDQFGNPQQQNININAGEPQPYGNNNDAYNQNNNGAPQPYNDYPQQQQMQQQQQMGYNQGYQDQNYGQQQQQQDYQYQQQQGQMQMQDGNQNQNQGGQEQQGEKKKVGFLSKAKGLFGNKKK